MVNVKTFRAQSGWHLVLRQLRAEADRMRFPAQEFAQALVDIVYFELHGHGSYEQVFPCGFVGRTMRETKSKHSTGYKSRFLSPTLYCLFHLFIA